MDINTHKKADQIRKEIEETKEVLEKLVISRRLVVDEKRTILMHPQSSSINLEIPATHAEFFLDNLYTLCSRKLDRLEAEYAEL